MTLTQALEIKKYGGLNTWRELFFYQRHCNDSKQMREISNWAKRFNRGELIVLPLIKNIAVNTQPDTVKDAESAFGVYEQES